MAKFGIFNSFDRTLYILITVLDYVYGKFMCKVYFQDPYPFFTHHRFFSFRTSSYSRSRKSMSTSTFAVKPLGIIEPFFNDDATHSVEI